MRVLFHKQLAELKTQVKGMKTLCEDILKLSMRQNNKSARDDITKIELMVTELSAREKEIYEYCELILIKQQPVADDLETISKTLRIILDLRRIGEISLNCAKILADVPDVCRLALLDQMADLTLEMFDLLKHGKEEEIFSKEDIMDACFTQMKDEICNKLQSPNEHAKDYLEILLSAKYFEKIADHIVAIAWA